MSKKERKVLHEIDNVRIVEYDQLNVMVERYEEVHNPVSKESTMRWRFKGYYPNVKRALKGILDKCYLIDNEAVADAQKMLERIKELEKRLEKRVMKE